MKKINLHGLQDITNEIYHASPGISSSQLSLLAESPVHLANRDLFKFNSTAFDFGSLVHSLVLEPHKVQDEFVIMPSFDGRTKDGKAAKAIFEANTNGKNVITADDFAKAEKISYNVRTIAGGLLKGGAAEQSYFADDDGLLVKCRPDYYHYSSGVIVDIKTTSDISEYGIRKSIESYKYNWSAAWYMRVLLLLGLPAERFVFVFVDKAAPHMVKIRELSPEALANADYEIVMMLEKYREYLATFKANVIHTLTMFGE